MTIQELRRFLGFPLEDQYRESVERSLVTHICRAQWIMGAMIMIFQLVMMVAMAMRPGGLFESSRRIIYFIMYIALLLASAAAEIFTLVIYRKHPERSRSFLNCVAVYAAFIALWSCGITLLDQVGGNSLTVYTYVLLTLSAFAALKPWQSITIFGPSFVLLNVFLAVSPIGGFGFGNTVNSLCVTLLAVAVSIMLYRYRVSSCHDAIIIQQQYEEIRKINQELQRQVLQDGLTKMHNRRYLEETGRARLLDCWERGGAAAGMMVDIDHFKMYNDRFGHQQGDACLQAVAKILMYYIEEADGCAVRYGGEEFFLCLFDCDEQSAMETANRLCGLVRDQRLIRQDEFGDYVTISIGLYVSGPTDLNTFVERADLALYRAKEAGRNRVSL